MIKLLNLTPLAGEGGSDLFTYVIIGGALLMLVAFFFLNGRTSKKKAKEMENNLKVGVKISTIGGIIGEVVEMTETEITVKTGSEENVSYMRFIKQAVSYVYPEGALGGDGEKKEEEAVYNEIK